jgi:hypothetical protein
MTSQRLSLCWTYSYDGLGAYDCIETGVVNMERWGRFLYIVKLRSMSAFTTDKNTSLCFVRSAGIKVKCITMFAPKPLVINVYKGKGKNPVWIGIT